MTDIDLLWTLIIEEIDGKWVILGARSDHSPFRGSPGIWSTEEQAKQVVLRRLRGEHWWDGNDHPTHDGKPPKPTKYTCAHCGLKQKRHYPCPTGNHCNECGKRLD